MSRDAMQQAKSVGFWQEHIDTWMCTTEDIKRFAELVRAEELAKPELMRMPKIDDRVVFIEGGIDGTVRLISPTGGPFIKFDDGTDGQWSLYEFGEMFYYQGKE